MDTRPNPSQPSARTRDGRHSTPRDLRFVVGLDNRGRSVSALVWAIEEAERGGAALTLVTARPVADEERDPLGAHDLSALARRLSLASVARKEVVGDPVSVLLDAAAEGDLLVVGCRTMHATQRMVLGGTSLALAGWSPVPVVVVPETWMQPTMASSPVVVGVRPMDSDGPRGPAEEDDEVLDFAFARAADLKVPLAVVSAWEPPTLTSWSPGELAELRTEHNETLVRYLTPWHEAFPQVDVSVHTVAEKPHHALLEASRVAQMIVIGRHHSSALSGTLGSTARAVLRHSSRPVAVVPAGSRDELVRDYSRQRSWAERPWTPI